MKKSRLKVQNNIRWLVLILVGFIGIVTLRYGYVQLVQGSALAERMRQQVGLDYQVQSPRGAIIDRNGRALAVSAMTKSLFFRYNLRINKAVN